MISGFARRPCTSHDGELLMNKGLNKRLRRQPQRGAQDEFDVSSLVQGKDLPLRWRNYFREVLPEWRQVLGGFETCRHLAGVARAGNVRPPTGRKSAHRAGPGTSPKPFRPFPIWAFLELNQVRRAGAVRDPANRAQAATARTDGG